MAKPKLLNPITRRLENSITITTDGTTNVPIGIPSYNPVNDVLDVFVDNIPLFKSLNYIININNTSIDTIGFSLDSGKVVLFRVWQNISSTPTVLTDGSQLSEGSISNTKLNADIKIGSLAQLVTQDKSSVVSALNELKTTVDNKQIIRLENAVQITNATVSNVPIGIPSFDYTKDILTVVYRNMLLDSTNYSLNVNHTSIDMASDFILDVGSTIYFYVLKNVSIAPPSLTSGSQIADDSISNSKLGTDLKIGSNSNLQTKDKSSLVSAINEAVNYPVNNMSRQAIINGNFDVWQRGTSWTNPSSGTYTADRWIAFMVNSGTLPTLVLSRQQQTSDEVQGSYYYYRLNTNGTGTGFGATDRCQIETHIENGTKYLCGLGKKVTLSFWARSNIPNKRLGVFTNQNYGTGGTPSSAEGLGTTTFNLTSNWMKYSYTITTNTLSGKTFGTNNDDFFAVSFFYMWGSGVGLGTAETFIGAGNIDLAQVQLCAGDVALPFQPKSFEEELRACMRYYEKSYNYGTSPGSSTLLGLVGNSFSTGTDSSGYFGYYVPFKVRKRLPPTVTVYDGIGNSGKVRKVQQSTLATDNITANISDISENSFNVYMNGSSAVGFVNHYTADAEL